MSSAAINSPPRPEDIHRALEIYIAAVRARFGQRLRAAFLFGSRGRGDMRPDSDADVAVILTDQGFDFWREKVALADLAYEPLLETGLRIQPWPVSESGWADPDKHHNPRLVRNMKRDGRPLLLELA